MVWLMAFIAVVAAEWAIHPLVDSDMQWEIALAVKYLQLAFVLTALSGVAGSLMRRSIIIALCVAVWVDTAGHMAFVLSGHTFDSKLPIFLIYSVCMIWLMARRYDCDSDQITGNRVFLLFHRPIGAIDTLKAFFGFPCDSVCIYAGGKIWSYRRKAGEYRSITPSKQFLAGHIVIDTGAEYTPAIEKQLKDLAGTHRRPGIKCVWTIRHILAQINLEPRCWELIPGLYAERIMRHARKHP